MKTIKTMAAVAAIALPLQFAQAEDATFNAQIVLPSVTGFSGGMGVALGYEMPMPDVNPNFSIEGEFTKSLSSPDNSGFEISYYTLAGYAKYSHPINAKLDVFGRVGLLYESVEMDYAYPCLVGFTFTTCSASASETDTGLSLGGGINYTLNPQMDFTAGYTIIESDINHLSAGIKFKM